MFSKILVKLVDEAIIPAVFLVITRVLSIILISRHFGLDYTLDSSGFVYSNPGDFTFVNSYSTLVMICVISVGLLYVLVKSFHFHDTHITPSFTVKLFSLKLSSFIQTSFDIYSQGAVWLSYSYLLMLISGLMTHFEILYPWVFWVSVVLTILCTYFFIFDVEKELSLGRSPLEGESGEELVLTLEEIE